MVLTVSNHLKKTSSQPCDRLASCAGCILPLTRCMLGQAPVSETLNNPRLKGLENGWIEEWMETHPLPPVLLISLRFLYDWTGVGWRLTTQLFLIHLCQISDFPRRDG